MDERLDRPTTALKINFGSAGHPKPGYINVDWNDSVHPDVSHDLNIFPYPFPTGSASCIEASHVLEHLDRPFRVMAEFHRILRSGGRLVVKLPHFSRGMTHPEHAHGFDVTFPNYFNRLFADEGYFGIDFVLERLQLRWLAFFHIVKKMGYGRFSAALLRTVSGVISFFANLHPGFCARIWCFWVGGFDEIEFHFRKP